MANNYFISGMPKSGKTTLLRRLVGKMREQGLKVGGFLSPDQKAHGARTGFMVEDIETGRVERLAATDIDGPKVSKYHVNIKAFESLVVPVFERASRYDVIVIDEIGRMEMKSTKFGELLEDLLGSPTPLVASLHRDYIDDYRAWGEVQIITPSNWGRIYQDLLVKVLAYRKKRVAARAREKRAKARKPVARAKRKPKGKAKKTPAKKGKGAKAKTRREKEELERMTEDLLRHRKKAKEEKAEEHGKKERKDGEEKKEETHHEEKKPEHHGRKHPLRELLREHVGV